MAAELSVWTSVSDCLVAARWLEGRSIEGDVPESRLIVPFVDSDEFQSVFLKGITWMIGSYRVPPSKVKLAGLVDPHISAATRTTLIECRFKPNIDLGPAGHIHRLFPPLARHRDQRFLIIEDTPATIELTQNPLRCLLNQVSQVWPTASKMRALRVDAVKENREPPSIFHQPYTDGPLLALLEALTFHVQELEIGPRLAPAQGDINRGYRSFEVVARPPVEPKLFTVAQQLTEEMFRSLH